MQRERERQVAGLAGDGERLGGQIVDVALDPVGEVAPRRLRREHVERAGIRTEARGQGRVSRGQRSSLDTVDSASPIGAACSIRQALSRTIRQRRSSSHERSAVTAWAMSASR